MNITDNIDRIDLQDSQGWLDHLTYHLVRYKFAYRIINPNDIVLDYGCGSGYGSRMLAEKASKVIGIDNDMQAIISAKSSYTKENLTFIEVDLLQDEGLFPSAMFDVIICYEVIEHLERHNGIELLRQLRQKLKSNGILLLSCPKYKPYEERSPARKRLHLHEYTYKDLNDSLESVFARHIIFTQTDEIISMGNPETCWTYMAICYGNN